MARGLPLQMMERHTIRKGINCGLSNRAIASMLGRHHSVVSREVNRNGGREKYWSFEAERRAVEQRRRPKARKLAAHPQLWKVVLAGLRKRWSPGQISARLREDYPTDQAMRVSAETIYQTLFVQAKGALRAEVKVALRSGRIERRRRSRLTSTVGKIKNMVLVSDRPAEADESLS